MTRLLLGSALAALLIAPTFAAAQRSAPSVSEIVVTKLTDSTPPLLFGKKPNGWIIIGTGPSQIRVQAHLDPALLRELKLASQSSSAGHMKEAKLTCRKAGGDQWRRLSEWARQKKALPSVKLVLSRAGREGKPQPYLQYELKNVMISSYSFNSGGDRPSESLSLNFTKIEYKNVGMGRDGE